VGYRYYDKSEKEIRFPFGYGLSFTTFEYSNINIELASRDEFQYKVSCDVTNIGGYEAMEIVQLYVAPPQDGIHRPIRELKSFVKLLLKPGQTKKAEFYLEKRSFAIWCEDWSVMKGSYKIQLGSNCRNIHLEAELLINGEQLQIPDWQKDSWYENPVGTPKHQDWEAMLGFKVVEKTLKKGEFTMENTVMEMMDYSLLMKIMYKAIERTIAKGFGGKADYNNPSFLMMMSSSADNTMTSMKISGGMNNYLLEGMLEMANGHYLNGLRYILKK
jgi:beta-glucosidase